MNEDIIRKNIDESEIQLIKCWNALEVLKNYRNNSSSNAEQIISFQAVLSKVLFSLQNLLSKVKRQKKAVISAKSSTDRDLFLSKIRNLANYEDAIYEIIKLGKAFGDSFIWFFYHNDQELIAEHLKHQELKELPSGIGGLGELVLTQNIRHLSGKMILYHGMTNILRKGDVSLVDLKKLKIIGLGELKTEKKSSKTINLNLSVVGPKLPEDFNVDIRNTVNKENPKLPTDKMQKRFERQIDSAALAFNNILRQELREEIRDIDSQNLDIIKELYKAANSDEFIFKRSGSSLIIAAIKISDNQFSSKFLSTKDKNEYSSKLIGLQKRVMDIIIPESKFNKIIVGSLDPSKYVIGSIPLFWWPLKIGIIKDIFFRNVVFSTIFNPAYFLEELKKDGFSVSFGKNHSDYKLSKKIGEKSIGLYNIQYYMKLRQSCLFSESAILKLIKNSIRLIEEDKLHKITKNSRFNFQYFVKSGLP